MVRMLVCVVCVVFCGSPPRAPAQGMPLPPNDRNTQLFRGLFHFHKIEPEAVANLTPRYDYKNLIVVVLGNPNRQDVVNACRFALANGGAVLLASDLSMDFGTYLPSAGRVSFSGFHTLFTEVGDLDRPVFGRRGVISPILPGVVDQFGGRVVGARPEMDLFAPFGRLEVDGASYLTLGPARPRELPRNVAQYPAGAVVGTPRGQVPATDQHVFAAAGVGDARNPFRCVAMADPDVFSNKLIYASAPADGVPNDNLKFANALVQWLKGPEGRTKCLFVENGSVQAKFDEVQFTALQTGPMPPLPPVPVFNPFDEKFQQNLTDGLNKVAADAQDNNRFNNALADTNEKKAWVYRAVAILAAVVLFLLVRYRSLAGRFVAGFKPIPKDPHRLGPGTEVGSFEHRRLELLRGGNYGPPVRAYLRQLFEDRGLPAGYNGDWPPRFRFDLKNKDYLRRAVTTLWAEMTAAGPISYGRWKELEPLLLAARAAADDDRWWIEHPDDPHRGAA